MKKGNFNRPTAQKERKFGTRYRLPTLFHRVEFAIGQQSKKHTYQFTGSQRECTFVLMGSHLSKFLVIKGFVFGAVLYHAPGGFNHVIPKVAVAGFVHGRIFRLELSGLVLFPDDAAVFGKCIIALKALDGAKLSKDAAGVDRANTGHGGQDLVLRGIKALYGPLDGAIDGLKLFFKGADAVEGTANRNGQWLVKALVQPVGVLCGLLEQISGLFRVGDPPTAFGADESYQIIHGRVHDVLRGKVVRQDCFCCGAIFVREGMLILVEHGKFAELKENVVQHVGLLPGDAFRDMEPVPGKPLEGKVLCAPPGFGMDAPDPCKISDDERINAVIFVKGVKGLLVLFNLIRVKAVDLSGKRSQLFGGGEVVGDMYAVKTSGFQTNDDGLEFMVL